MKEWRSQGDRLMLLLEANEDIKNGNLERDIRSETEMITKDLLRERAHKYVPDTWCPSTNNIDGTFATPDMDCCGDRSLLFWSGMGYHRNVLVDITHQSLLG